MTRARRQGPDADPEMRRFFERFFGEQGQGQGRCGHRSIPMRERGEGSGFIINADGLIVTNAHVAGGADKIKVSLDDGTELAGQAQGHRREDRPGAAQGRRRQAPALRQFGDSSKVRVGDAVVAIGNPFGLGGTVTAGIVSATGREIGSGPYDDFLQIDAPINRGNSGGPTFNLQGEVVGINSAIFSPIGRQRRHRLRHLLEPRQAGRRRPERRRQGRARLARRADPGGRRGSGVQPRASASRAARWSAKSSRTARPRTPASSRATSSPSFDGKPIDGSAS